MFALAFRIPPDFDDTFVNIGLGSLLFMFRVDFPAGFQTWMKQNSNLTSVFEKVKKYAYRYTSLILILLELEVISLCHQHRARPAWTYMQSDQALYCWLTNFKISS